MVFDKRRVVLADTSVYVRVDSLIIAKRISRNERIRYYLSFDASGLVEHMLLLRKEQGHDCSTIPIV